jgi:hypothetical protein
MAVASAGGKFIAVGNTIMASTNGLDWEPAAGPTNFAGQDILLEHVAYGNGTYLASVHWANGFLAASSTGFTWHDVAPTNGLSLSRVTWGNGQFLAVEGNSGGISFSTDGIDWTAPASLSSGGRTCSSPYLRFEEGLFVADGEEGTLLISSDAKAWTLGEQQQALLFGPGRLINVEGRYFGAGGVQGIETSTNGSDWTLLLATNSFADLAYGGGTLVAVGGADAIFSSGDGGATWTDRSPRLNYGSATPWLTRIAYGGGRFVALGGLLYTNGTQKGHVLASGDGATWTVSGFSPTANMGYLTFNDVTYGGGEFVAVRPLGSYSGEILTSADGLIWKSAGVFPTNSLYTIAYGNGRFVVAGTADGSYQGVLLSSADGATWIRQSLPDVQGIGKIVFGNGFFLATLGDRGLLSSTDGLSWTKLAAPNAYFQSIAAGEGVFLAIGGDGLLYRSGPLERLGSPRRLANGALEWTVTGARHINYGLEFSEDLLNWQTFARVTNAPPTYSFTDPGAANRGGRFYRVVTE